MNPVARYLCGVAVFVVVVIILSSGMRLAGVPLWLRLAVSFGMGWTSARHLFALAFPPKGKP